MDRDEMEEALDDLNRRLSHLEDVVYKLVTEDVPEIRRDVLQNSK